MLPTLGNLILPACRPSQIVQPTKRQSPVIVGDQLCESPYYRQQVFGSVLSPDDYPNSNGKWRLHYMYKYGESPPGNSIFNIAIAEATSPEGPWSKAVTGSVSGCPNAVINDQQSWSVMYDQVSGIFRGAGEIRRGTSADGKSWSLSEWAEVQGPLGNNDTSTALFEYSEKGQKYFAAFVRDQGTWANGTLRKAGYTRSTDFTTWTQKSSIPVFDSPDGGWTQPYSLAGRFYKGKVVGLLWWLHLDVGGANNSVGYVDAELVWAYKPDGPWIRTHRTFLPIGAPGSFDAGSVEPAQFVAYNGTIYIFYTAFAQKHGIVMGPNEYTIGLATIDQQTFDFMVGVQ